MEDNLLAPLNQLEKLKKELAFDSEEEKIETKIPIPSPDYLAKGFPDKVQSNNTTLVKYGKEYEAYCKWSALPREMRVPKTGVEFEKKHDLPRGYLYSFKGREDYRDKVLTNFWNWMMDLYPEVVHAVYKRAVKNSDKAAGLFLDLINKHMKIDQPQVQVQPMILMGVSSDKIDALFTPKGFEKIQDITPGKKHGK